MVNHLAGLLRKFGPTEKTMVFYVDIPHAHLVARLLNEALSNLGLQPYAVPIVSEEGQAPVWLQQFQDSDHATPVVARTAELLSTGVDVLADVLGQSEADQFNLLGHLTFDAPLRTRSERATAFLNREARFLQAQARPAQEVLLALLEKYRAVGIEEINDPCIFRKRPLYWNGAGAWRGAAVWCISQSAVQTQ